MKYWISLLGAALAAAPGFVRAQKTGPAAVSATITGQLPGVPDSMTPAIFEPFPGLPLNYFFADGPNEATVRNGRFSYTLRHGRRTFSR